MSREHTARSAAPTQIPHGDLIIGAFFTDEVDPQSGRKVEGGYSNIANWVESVERVGCKGLVLHDGSLDDDEVYLHTSDNVSFMRVQHMAGEPHSQNDERFIVYNILMPQLRCENVFFTDLFDVTVNFDPFDDMQAGVLYHGTDDPNFNCSTNSWMRAKFEKFEHSASVGLAEWADWDVLNDGVIGGDKNLVWHVLERMKKLLNLTTDGGNYNMVAFNEAARHCSKLEPCTSVFKAFEKDSPMRFTHK